MDAPAVPPAPFTHQVEVLLIDANKDGCVGSSSSELPATHPPPPLQEGGGLKAVRSLLKKARLKVTDVDLISDESSPAVGQMHDGKSLDFNHRSPDKTHIVTL